jgi:hypothetical protein
MEKKLTPQIASLLLECEAVIYELHGYESSGVYIPTDLRKRIHGMKEALEEFNQSLQKEKTSD